MSKATIVAIARQILGGEIDPLVGCRRIIQSHDGVTLEEWDDPDMLTLRGIESDLDNYPLESARALWNQEALAEKDRYLAKLRERAEPDIREACRAIIEKFS